MATAGCTITIDQSAIAGAPHFPRSVEWWRRFLPIWFSEPRWWEKPDVDLTNSRISLDEDNGAVVIEALNKKHAATIVAYLRTGVPARYIPDSAIRLI